ncbi:DUF2164 domain-containing protein [Bordetella trematum]|uniref:DUF2164 domain-containing protein n=1 Tax=Bordetella trematum TaxID=123899 RepID=UPI001558C17A|nr:DUF2164 domain-containing protein [Bordetella trematum]
MSIELDSPARREAIASIQRYFDEYMETPIGNVAAGALLGFFLQEIGPVVYNQAVQDAQCAVQARIEGVALEVHEAPFTYWRQNGAGNLPGRR